MNVVGHRTSGAEGVLILSRYPAVFAAKTGMAGRRVVFLNDYAGRGEYEDGSPGSPLLLARTAEYVTATKLVVSSAPGTTDAARRRFAASAVENGCPLRHLTDPTAAMC
ncbi:MAG: hypothetical protein ACRD0H_29040, partial [Actinomycetes bacterium]